MRQLWLRVGGGYFAESDSLLCSRKPWIAKLGSLSAHPAGRSRAHGSGEGLGCDALHGELEVAGNDGR